MFPLSFAQAIGLDHINMKMQTTGGVGSNANATYYEKITVKIHIHLEQPMVFTALAGFTAGLEAQGIGLLGQDGFFENFSVAFARKDSNFTIAE